MKTNLSLRSASLNMIMSAAIASLLLSSCTKENVEPSATTASGSRNTIELATANRLSDQKDALLREQDESSSEQLMMQLDEIAPVGMPAFKVELLSSGKVRFTGEHDVLVRRAEMQIAKNRLGEIQDMMKKIKIGDASALLDLDAGQKTSSTTLTMPAITKGEMCFKSKTRTEKTPEQIIELKKAIFEAAGIAELIGREQK